MKTAEIKRALKLCKGSLQSVELVPILTHFCFDGDSVYAYNDITAVYVSLDTGLRLGVRGDTLVGVLETLGEDVKLEMVGEDALQMTSSKAKIKVAGLPASTFLLEIPDEPVLLQLDVNDALMRGIELCRATVGLNSLQREYTGVAFLMEEGTLNVYATDDTRLSRFTVDADRILECKAKKPPRFLVPAASCKQFLDVWNDIKEDVEGKPDKGVVLYFSKNWCWMGIERATVFSKLMPESPPDYPSMFEQVFPTDRKWAALPDGLVDAFKRAEVLTSRETMPLMHMTVEGKQLTVSVDKGTSLGHFTDSFVTGAGGGEKLKLTTSPSKVREAAEGASKFMLSERCLAFKSGEYLCLVSPYSSPE